MMKHTLFALFVAFSATLFAQKQKITVDEDTIKVDGTAYAIIEKKSGMTYDFTIKSMTGTPLMYWQFQEFNNPNKVNNSNPHGRVTYFQITFFNDKQQCEASPVATKKGIAKMIVESELISNQGINQEAENNFVLIQGSKFTEEKKTVNSTVIIINNH